MSYKQPYFTTTDSTEPGVTEAELAVRANVAAPVNKWLNVRNNWHFGEKREKRKLIGVGVRQESDAAQENKRKVAGKKKRGKIRRKRRNSKRTKVEKRQNQTMLSLLSQISASTSQIEMNLLKGPA